MGRLWAFPAVLFPGLWIACACAPLWAALWPVSGLACVPVPLPGCVALCALCGGCVHLCAAVPGLWLLRSVHRPGVACGRLWRDREKPGQTVQAPPGRKRTAAGIAPGAALWLYLFIFSNSDRIAKGIIKIIRTINIFDFHPLFKTLYYIASMWEWFSIPPAFLL